MKEQQTRQESVVVCSPRSGSLEQPAPWGARIQRDCASGLVKTWRTVRQTVEDKGSKRTRLDGDDRVGTLCPVRPRERRGAHAEKH